MAILSWKLKGTNNFIDGLQKYKKVQAFILEKKRKKKDEFSIFAGNISPVYLQELYSKY